MTGTRSLRVYLVLGTAQMAVLGLSGLLSPRHVFLPVPASPLNARVIGALYAGAAVAAGLSAISRDLRDARLFLAVFGVITPLILGFTLADWHAFTRTGLPLGWLFTYVTGPLVSAVAFWRLRLWRASSPGFHPRSWVLAVHGALLVPLGLFLLLAPARAADHWPWLLPRLDARIYGPFFLGVGVGALLAAHERRPSALRPFLAGALAQLVLMLLGSLAHHGRFQAGLGRDLWFAALVVGSVAFARALQVSRLARAGAG